MLVSVVGQTRKTADSGGSVAGRETQTSHSSQCNDITHPQRTGQSHTTHHKVIKAQS